MIAIIDYGVGNLFSLTSSLQALGAEVRVTADPKIIKSANRLILPGVGAFGDAMLKLNKLDLVSLILNEVKQGKLLLGICLGMQLLFKKSYEYGDHEGLGLIDGFISSLDIELRCLDIHLKVPHMGWNALIFHQLNCPLLRYNHEGDFVYFVHSYYAKECQDNLVATTEYGIQIPAIVWKKNIFGCQFHPEKSGKVGLSILQSYLNL